MTVPCFVVDVALHRNCEVSECEDNQQVRFNARSVVETIVSLEVVIEMNVREFDLQVHGHIAWTNKIGYNCECRTCSQALVDCSIVIRDCIGCNLTH